MTPDRMAQLFEDAIFTQEELEAVTETNEEPQLRFSHHECYLRARLEVSQACAPKQSKGLGYQVQLHEHYLLGAPHPHDVNYSLDQWDEID